MIVCDGIWSRELAKPSEERDWEHVKAKLKQVTDGFSTSFNAINTPSEILAYLLLARSGKPRPRSLLSSDRRKSRAQNLGLGRFHERKTSGMTRSLTGKVKE